MVEGSVTISIRDYHALLDASIKAKTLEESTKLAAKEIQVFLSFIYDKVDIQSYIDEFNRQSKKSKITVTNGRIQIKLNEEKENNS
tara:strand:- start:347 stop:604 length:258 start_codon:yes stop_codon:yes gene_type:complete